MLQEHLIGATCMQVEVLSFEADIRGQWAAEAMRWMLQSSSRHLTARSHQVVIGCSLYALADRAARWLPCTECVPTAILPSQVFRALQSEREAEACSTLLACLHKCLQPNAQKASYHDCVEVCLTLQVCRLLSPGLITKAGAQFGMPSSLLVLQDSTAILSLCQCLL